MTGSDGKAGKRPGTASPRRTLRRRAGSGHGGGGTCFVCERSRRTAWCEQRRRIFKHLEEAHPLRNPWCTPRLAAVCKDCCIGGLDGHHCPWWDLCWGG